MIRRNYIETVTRIDRSSLRSVPKTNQQRFSYKINEPSATKKSENSSHKNYDYSSFKYSYENQNDNQEKNEDLTLRSNKYKNHTSFLEEEEGLQFNYMDKQKKRNPLVGTLTNKYKLRDRQNNHKHHYQQESFNMDLDNLNIPGFNDHEEQLLWSRPTAEKKKQPLMERQACNHSNLNKTKHLENQYKMFKENQEICNIENSQPKRSLNSSIGKYSISSKENYLNIALPNHKLKFQDQVKGLAIDPIQIPQVSINALKYFQPNNQNPSFSQTKVKERISLPSSPKTNTTTDKMKMISEFNDRINDRIKNIIVCFQGLKSSI